MAFYNFHKKWATLFSAARSRSVIVQIRVEVLTLRAGLSQSGHEHRNGRLAAQSAIGKSRVLLYDNQAVRQTLKIDYDFSARTQAVKIAGAAKNPAVNVTLVRPEPEICSGITNRLLDNGGLLATQEIDQLLQLPSWNMI